MNLQDLTNPYTLLVLLLITMFLFVWGRWRYDLVAFFTLMAAVVLQLIPPDQAFSGFSNPAVIMVAAIMILSRTVSESGIIDNAIIKLAPLTKNKTVFISLLCLIVAVLSAFMNNTGALALLIPVTLQTCMQNKHHPSHVLMPTAFASALGGMVTLIGTPPNILIATIRAQHTGTPFALFDFAPVGLIVAGSCIFFIIFIGWRFLPSRSKANMHGTDLFKIQDYITEVRIPKGSVYDGKTKREFMSMSKADLAIVGMIRKKRKSFIIRPGKAFKAGDILIIEAVHKELKKIQDHGHLELINNAVIASDIQTEEVELSEAVIPADSRLVGRSFKQSHIKYRYRINLIAISRQGKSIQSRLADTNFKAGDVVLLQGAHDSIQEAVTNLSLLPLLERGILVPNKHHTYLPLIAFGLALAAIAILKVPVQISFCLAILALILTKTLPLRHIYRSIDWSVIMLLGAMIPVGQALERTGTTDIIANFLTSNATQGSSPILFMAGLMFLTMLISNVMNNVTTTVIMAPIAIAVAHTFHVNIDPFLMAVCVGASCSFLTPIGHQNNVLVMGPGGYRFSDYCKLGLPVELIALSVGVPAIAWIWPL